MIKRLSAVFALALAIAGYAGAQERIAVLDTDIPKGIDTKVVIPITEKIMEEFVRSKLFIVLDRSFIAKTLSEQEFSTSDLTTGDSEKLATIGGFLKATYIVVSTVQKLDTRYFLSAKMIEVKSGVIVAQTSVDRDGSVSVLIDMAGELGRKLVASAMGQDTVAAGKSSGRSAPEPSKGPTQATAPQSDAAAAKEPREPRAEKPAKNRFATVSADIGSGSVVAIDHLTTGDYDLISWYPTSAYDPETLIGTAYGVSGIFPAGLFYVSVGVTVCDAYYGDGLYSASGVTYETTIQTLDGFLGLGIDLPIGPILLYAGPRLGYEVIAWEQINSNGGSGTESWSGIGFGFEAGADIKLGGFAIGIRYASMSAVDMESPDYSDTLDLTTGALVLRVGFAF